MSLTMLAIVVFTMSATPQFGVKIVPNLAPCQQYLKPDDASKDYHEPAVLTKPSSKSQGPQKAPTCSVRHISLACAGWDTRFGSTLGIGERMR